VALTFGRDTAERAVASVVEETQRLSDFPELGRRCNEYKNARRQYRAINTRHDRIVYTITADRVLIVAVFDCRRDPAELTSMVKERDTQNR
jgi:plasmid stabilization system protein ParE